MTDRGGLLTLVWLRFLVVSVILGSGILVMKGYREESVTPFYALLGITTFLTVAYSIAARYGGRLRLQAWIQLIADVGLATGIVYYTGGMSSPFALLYVLTITAGSAFLLLRGTVLLGVLCTIACSVLAAVEQGGTISGAGNPLSWNIHSEAGRYMILQIGLYGITFLSVALLSGYLSVRLSRRGVALDAVRSKLRQVHLDTDQILRSLSSGLMTVDRYGRIMNFNRAAEEICGIKSDHVIGKSYEDAFGQFAPEMIALINGILSGGESALRQETNLVSLSGEIIPLGVSVSALRDVEGENAGVVAIFQNLTEVRKMEEQIRHADRLAAVGELSAGIAHEIRNPLATISGSIQVLKSELPVEGENKRLLELVVRESDRLHRIIEEFLEFARIRPARQVRVDFRMLIEGIIDQLPDHPKMRENVRIHLQPDIPSAEVLADEELIRTVFLNLAINGMEAMNGGGDLTIGVREVESFRGSPDAAPTRALAVRIEDTGEGIPDENRKELFNPFFTTKKGGTGLGLSMAQKIVLRHNGKIELESGPWGSAFTVYLPWDGAKVIRTCEVAI